MRLLSDLAPDTTWDDVARLAPAGVDAVVAVQRGMWDGADAVLLELVRLRIATLLGAQSALAMRSDRARQAGLDENKIASLAAWPVSPLFDARERACLALAEQFMVDVNGVTDDQVDAVIACTSPAECNVLVSAMWAFEQFQRMCLVLGVDPPAHAAGLDIDGHGSDRGGNSR